MPRNVVSLNFGWVREKGKMFFFFQVSSFKKQNIFQLTKYNENLPVFEFNSEL